MVKSNAKEFMEYQAKKGKAIATPHVYSTFCRNIEGAKFQPERGITLEDLIDTPIPDRVALMNWEKLVEPQERFNKELVNEFYKLADPEKFWTKEGVIIRGVKVSFEPEKINTFYGIKNVWKRPEAAFDSKFGSTLEERIPEGLISSLVGNPIGIKTLVHTELDVESGFWQLWQKHNLTARPRNQEPNDIELKVLLSLKKGKPINIGLLRVHTLREKLRQGNFSLLPLPCFITQMCRKARVPEYEGDRLLKPKITMNMQDWTTTVSNRGENPSSRKGKSKNDKEEGISEEEEEEIGIEVSPIMQKSSSKRKRMETPSPTVDTTPLKKQAPVPLSPQFSGAETVEPRSPASTPASTLFQVIKDIHKSINNMGLQLQMQIRDQHDSLMKEIKSLQLRTDEKFNMMSRRIDTFQNEVDNTTDAIKDSIDKLVEYLRNMEDSDAEGSHTKEGIQQATTSTHTQTEPGNSKLNMLAQGEQEPAENETSPHYDEDLEDEEPPALMFF